MLRKLGTAGLFTVCLLAILSVFCLVITIFDVMVMKTTNQIWLVIVFGTLCSFLLSRYIATPWAVQAWEEFYGKQK